MAGLVVFRFGFDGLGSGWGWENADPSATLRCSG